MASVATVVRNLTRTRCIDRVVSHQPCVQDPQGWSYVQLRRPRGGRRGKGTVGVGYGKSREVPAAIAKGQLDAKKHMFTVPRIKGTVTHPVIGHDAAGTVLLRPAAPGTGVIAGGAVRAVMECAGITDVLTKSMGSATAVNVVRATVDALKKLEEPEEIAARRGMSLEEVAPDALLRARAEGIAEARKAREEAQAKAAQKDGE